MRQRLVTGLHQLNGLLPELHRVLARTAHQDPLPQARRPRSGCPPKRVNYKALVLQAIAGRCSGGDECQRHSDVRRGSFNRAKGPRTTIPGAGPDTRPDLVDRTVAAPAAPDRLWVADITYGRTFAGWVYAAFVIDVFSRRVVGWQLFTSLRTDLALDTLEMGLWTRQRECKDPKA